MTQLRTTALAHVIGVQSQESRARVRTALARVDVEPRFHRAYASLSAALRDDADGTDQASFVLVDVTTPESMNALGLLRNDPALHGVPIVLAVPAAVGDAFREAYEAGADGVLVADDDAALTRHAFALRGTVAKRGVVQHGTALIAHADPERRALLARGLRRAGFASQFASTPEEVLSADSGSVLVVSDELLGDTPELTAAACHERLDAPVVVLAPARRLQPGPIARGAGVVIANEHVDLAGLLFWVTEAARPPAADARLSRRLLYRNTCFVREAGRALVRHGLSLNISREGLYVQTLDAPEPGTDVWLEIVPPESTQLVHLRGRVVWRRQPGSSLGGPGTAGYGIRLAEDECPPADITAYRAGYERLLTHWRSDGLPAVLAA